MKSRIEKYKIKLQELEVYIQQDLVKYLKAIDLESPSSDIQILNLKNEEDINNAIYSQGFYIILTNHIFENNDCNFRFQNKIAIYRGHSYFIKKRILSHLANTKYNSERKDKEPNYKVCLKINDGINGININNEPYNTWGWTVVILKMKGSTALLREQAETAFDIAFNRPCKSREASKNTKRLTYEN